ncbi:MAG TPA: glycoside hydrolase family 71/99-like protein [Chitinophaga sp.]|uniref:glycoside hydrolase family 71/99-like protein n=1 Tax=Chitinophaga sp. TaxID=1869181 RepID=UPI002CA7D083|nr:glycoside hydrolase family 71/99-like protein [Chitinophaga sp.]HVI47316.1 glycoside hydrolase family 71/99-like protein [Chitinophaga sp.]
MKPVTLLAICCTLLLMACQKTPQPVTALSPNAAHTELQSKAAAVFKSTNKKIFIHWIPWFETPASKGAWGYHWKMNTQNPDIIVNGKRQIAAWYYPQTGPYASSDPDIIEYQLLLMKYAGADGVFIDWPGTRQRYDYPDNLFNSNALINKLDAAGLQFAIVHEDRNWDAGMTSGGHDDFVYMQNNYFSRSNYFRVNNTPVVLNFGPITFHQSSEWDQILNGINPRPKVWRLFGFTNQVGTNNAGGEYPWIYQDHPGVVDNYYSQLSRFPTPIGVVYPGFHTFYAAGNADGPNWQIPYNGTGVFSLMIDKALQSSVPIIQFATWNDYGEGTMIEPTQEFGYGFLTVMQQKLGVPYGQHELDLVYRLYKARKQFSGNNNAQQQLNQVFSYLANLQVSQAETLLNQADGGSGNNGVYIKNKWLSTYLYEENGQVKYSSNNNGNQYKWIQEQMNGHTRFRNLATGHYMNIENRLSYVECTAVPNTFYSSYWVLENYNGATRLKNEWQNTYLNLENQSGTAQCTAVPGFFESSQWILQP